MIVTIQLHSLLSRLALALTAIALVAVFVGVLYFHFLVRALADPRTTFDQQALSLAAQHLPASARVKLRLAEAAADNADASALQYAAQAVNLNPWNYQAWRALAMAQETSGDENAEQSLRTAARLAPHHAEVNWQLANLLLRRGQLRESLAPFRVAVESNKELLPTVYDLLWQAAGGALDPLKAMAGSDAEAQLTLAQFLTEQGRAAEAVNVFRESEPRARLASPRTAGFIASLINAGQYEMARTLWLESVSAQFELATRAHELVWNGSYELDPLPSLDHFDWKIKPSEYARIGVERGAAHSGERALKLAFIGRDTTRLDGEVRQLVALRPGVSYRLEGYAQAVDLLTSEGPRLAILSAQGLIAASPPVAGGTTDWQHLTVDFTAPAEGAANYIAIVRTPRFSYDAPTRGVVWFDDLRLLEQARSK